MDAPRVTGKSLEEVIERATGTGESARPEFSFL